MLKREKRSLQKKIFSIKQSAFTSAHWNFELNLECIKDLLKKKLGFSLLINVSAIIGHWSTPDLHKYHPSEYNSMYKKSIN